MEQHCNRRNELQTGLTVVMCKGSLNCWGGKCGALSGLRAWKYG